MRNLLYEQLSDGQLACFAHRPSRVFEDAHVKPGIITGQKDVVEDDSEEGEENGESPEAPHSIESSRFIRFDESNRNDRLSDIEYAATDGLVLGEDYIGSGENYSIPKLGSDTARNIIEKLKSQSVITQENGDSKDGDNEESTGRDDEEDEESEVINTIGTRLVEDRETDHLMWRRRGSLYWINPMLTNLYENKDKDTPTSMYKMYFESDIERRCAFLILQSSLYYHYWMVYKNGRNIDWWEIRPFPFPDDESLEENADEIKSLSTELWAEMEDRFVGAARTVFEDSAELKPVVDRVDDLLGEMYGLTDEEIDHLKQFDAEYGRTV